MSIPSVTLRGITKNYGQRPVIRDLSLELFEGEIFALLGPSGCGKTTTLRILAGLETADAGEIVFRERTWLNVSAGIAVAPQKRNIGMVFQSYAIWPHMTVMQHVMYPLRRGETDKHARRERAREVINLVGLSDHEQASAAQLSGGQQQRVAFARAIVTEPDLLLLDEPFSNLDVHLREQMRIELAQLQRKLGITMLLVTHDQLDAFALSDRIGLMRDGRLDQVDNGQKVYEQPNNRNVREFVGKSIVLEGVVRDSFGGACSVGFSNGSLLRIAIPADKNPGIGRTIRLWFRPEDVIVKRRSERRDSNDGLAGRIAQIVFMGDRYQCLVQLDWGQMVLTYASRSFHPRLEEQVTLVMEPGSVRLDEE